MTGRRQQVKGALREQIVRSGLALFAEHGFDAVTVEQIAGAAGVSPITVYRHFGTKDAIVFDTRLEAAALLRELAADVPASADPRVCVAAVLRGFAAGPQDQELYELRSAIVARSPNLQRLSLATRVEFEQALADALCARPLPGPGWETRLAAAAGMAAFHVVVRQWRDSPDDLVTLTDAGLRALWPDLA